MTDTGIQHQLKIMYRQIHRERMQDLPMCNNKIGIHAIGFEPWNGNYLGVMITPWFMNLMLLPATQAEWRDKRILSEEVVAFPSGNFRFVLGEEESIGKYLSCSLFSMMHEFQNDQAALETGQAVLLELMNTEHKQYCEFSDAEVMQRWQQQDELKQQARITSNRELKESEDTDPLEESSQLSRRQLFGGNKMEPEDHARN